MVWPTNCNVFGLLLLLLNLLTLYLQRALVPFGVFSNEKFPLISRSQAVLGNLTTIIAIIIIIIIIWPNKIIKTTLAAVVVVLRGALLLFKGIATTNNSTS